MALDNQDLAELTKNLNEISKTINFSEVGMKGMTQEDFVKQMVDKLSGMNLSKSELADTQMLKVSCMIEICKIQSKAQGKDFNLDEKVLFDLSKKAEEAPDKEKENEKKEEFMSALMAALKELYELKLKNQGRRDDDNEAQKENKLQTMLDKLKDPKESKENQSEYGNATKDLYENELSNTLQQLYGTDITKLGAIAVPKTYIGGNPEGFVDYEQSDDDPNYMAKDDKDLSEKKQEDQGLIQLLDSLLDGIAAGESYQARSPFTLPGQTPRNTPDGS